MRMRIWLVLLAALPLLTVGSGATAGTSVPPQNGLIAAFGGDGIYLIDAQRAKAWKVPGTDELGAPAWSPDGSLLAVEGWEDNGSSVYTIRPDGSDRRLVLENASSPSWSPDGTRLVVVRESAGRDRSRHRPGGRERRPVSSRSTTGTSTTAPAARVVARREVDRIQRRERGGQAREPERAGRRRPDDRRRAGGTSPGLRMVPSLPSTRSTSSTSRRSSVFDLATGTARRLCSRVRSPSRLWPGLRTESSWRSSRSGRCRRAQSATAAARCRWISGR